MSRCGCGTACSCLVQAQAGTPITVIGSGSAANPYVIGTTGSIGACTDVMACVCAATANGLTCAGGRLAARLSTDTGNAAGFGTDGGIYVAGGPGTSLVTANTSTVNLQGLGTIASPMTATARVSAAANNAVTANADGLYVPRVQAGVTLMSAVSVVSVTKTVTFPVAFSATPSMATNLTANPGGSAFWYGRALAATATSFLMFFGTTGAAGTMSVNVDWIATERTAPPT